MEKDMYLDLAELSNCEKMVLSCIYEHQMRKETIPKLKDIMDLLEEKYHKVWKSQTVCTFLTRMEKKGVLVIEHNYKASKYKPVIEYEEFMERELKGLCGMYFSNDMKQFKKFVRTNL